MKGNKIIATLIVLAMLLSTLVVLNQLNTVNNASAQPGVDAWGNATTELVYDVAYTSININTSGWTIVPTSINPCYLYYPTYTNTGAGPNAASFTWNGPFKVGTSVYVNTVSDTAPLEPDSATFKFNRSGMWIFDNNSIHTDGYAGYIWVNSSPVYTIQSIADIGYGASGSLTVTVDTGSDSGCMISILRPDNSTMYHKWRSTGISSAIKIEEQNFSFAGEYTVKAYRDMDLQDEMYLYADEAGNAYGPLYGNSTSFPIAYGYATIGPWDPPEKCADDKTFTVNTGRPVITLSNNSFFWGYPAWIDINVTDSDGNGLDSIASFYLKYGAKNLHNFTSAVTFTDDNATYGEALGNYSIYIPRWTGVGGWSALAHLISTTNNNVNGTWRLYFGYDAAPQDDIYEWNNSATFTVKSSNPPVQIVIVDDGDGNDDKELDVPAYTTGLNHAPTYRIEFEVIGTSISDVAGRAYYGDNNLYIVEDYKNITIAGDILYPVDAAYIGGLWTADVTPTKVGGTITLSVDWPGDHNGTASETIEIVKGASVTPAVNSFTVGEHFNLTVTVKDSDGDTVKNAQVWLMWEESNVQFDSKNGTNKAGNGLNGEYTFWISPENDTTPTVAPQNITVAARWYEGYWAYTKVTMERNHNMMVNITPTTGYAGEAVEYDIVTSLVGGGHPKATGLTVALYNETGANLAGIWSKDGDYDITNEQIILPGGTYHFAAMNNTCDSKGHNATLIITNYIVVSSPSILAWKIDTDTNVTFHLTPVGNGTLTINNMTTLPNASYPGQSNQIPIESGVGTLYGVNATTLGNVTFCYTPDGGESSSADGLLRVTTATATPNPATIYNGEPTMVTIKITHPATGTPLEDVRVGLDHGMLLNESILAKLPTDVFTDANGQAEFSITADASGEVTIYIENETDPDNEFVITAQARKPMTISVNPSVNEGKTFTVEAKSYGVIITDTPVTFTFDGQTWPTTTGVATLTAPSVTTSLTYPITATAEGYVTASGAIMVVNIPKLIVAIAGEVKTGQTFTMTIADDTGSPVIGATITFDGKTYKTGAGGETTITAPSTEGTYPVTATFPGYETLSDTVTVVKGGGIPGFELVTLIAAIGVAFLLLRRRRN